MKKITLVFVSLFLAACSSASPQTEAAKAEESMRAFFSALADGQYTEAINLYGGDYEILAGWNPDLSPTDYESLWQRGCEQNGLVCMEVMEVFNAQESGAGFEFTVTFKTRDGELFQFEGCCGETLPEPITEYAISVQKDDDGHKVLSLPPYIP